MKLDAEAIPTSPQTLAEGLQSGMVRRMLEHLQGLSWHDSAVRKEVYNRLNERLARRLADDHARGTASVFDNFEPTFANLVERLEAAAERATSFEELKSLAIAERHPEMSQEDSSLQRFPGPTATSARPEPDTTAARPVSSPSVERPEGRDPVGASASKFAPPLGALRPDVSKPATSAKASPAAQVVGGPANDWPGPAGGESRAEPQKPRPESRLRDWGVALLAVAAFALAIGQFFVQWRGSAPDCGADSTVCFDSGWQPASNAQTSTYFYRNKLSALPRNLVVWFSPTNTGSEAFLAYSGYPSPQTGNPITIQAEPGVVYLQVAGGVPIHGTFDAAKNQWTTYTQGFFRVIATQ